MRNTALAAAVAAVLLSANLGAQPAPVPSNASAQADASPADDSGPVQDNPRLAQAREMLATLKFQQGNIAVPGSDAHFNLGPDFRYLGKDDTRKVLEQVWRNPPDDSVLGMVVPSKT